MQKSEMLLTANVNPWERRSSDRLYIIDFESLKTCGFAAKCRSDDRRSQGVSFPQTKLSPRLAHEKTEFFKPKTQF